MNRERGFADQELFEAEANPKNVRIPAPFASILAASACAKIPQCLIKSTEASGYILNGCNV
jgi:hypothetical protein